ncbi:MAG: hypothetical protein HYV95_17720 [Opitutae bacterium]|nr:hypothetical protein [Opitutae bacterium]
MNTRIRLVLMLGTLLLAFALGAWALQNSHSSETGEMLAAQHRDRAQLLERLLSLTGQPLQGFASDYAQWDDMVAFVASGDKAWAAINIDASLPNFNAEAAWVVCADGRLVYGAERQPGSGLAVPPVPLAPLLPRLQRERFMHFFAEAPGGRLLEIRAAPIQPSADLKRTSPPLGWYLVARHWSEAHLITLRETMESEIALRFPSAAPPPADPLGIELHHPLPGWDGRTVRVLQVRYHPAALASLLENNTYEMAIFCGFGLAVIGFTLTAVSYLVIRPLQQIERSFTQNSPAPLAPLRGQPNEFGRIARLTEASFTSRAALEGEVEERKRAEIALRASEEGLRRSTELRTRLARDLHDSVIQSIYAAGLGLESMRHSLRQDPVAAEQRLTATLASLNQTIREIRSFIGGLEPEQNLQPQFALALRTLVETLQALHPLRFELQISEEAAARLTAPEEVHALQIVRECVSNALRHSGASRVRVGLRQEGGHAVLSIEDDGCGFDPAAEAGKGSGLANIASRVGEMGAQVGIDSAPAKGTRLTVTFNHTAVTA